jgi:hypothetical protein
MAQTPKSVSIIAKGATNSTVYTVPAATTAVVKSVIAAPIQGSASTSYTISKVSGGVVYPITIGMSTLYTAATGATNITNTNLIDAPITLAAGESITAYAGTVSQYRLPDVSTFTKTALTGNAPSIRKIFYANSIYMAVGTYSTPSTAFVATSPDGVTWTEQTSVIGFPELKNITFLSTGSVWIATGLTSVIYSTNNGITWNPVASLPDANNIAGITASTTTAVIITTSSTIWQSTNGTTWTLISGCPASGQTGQQCLAFANGYFVISNDNATCVSTDLTNWQFLGAAQNRTIATAATAYRGITYSSAYDRYYQSRITIADANVQISRSTVGSPNLYTPCTVAASQSIGIITAAGSNTIIIANNAASSTTKWKSTDGLAFTQYVDSRSATGQVLGLANGYYYTFTTLVISTYYISTDPSTSTGVISSAGAVITDVTCGAADPVSGAYVLFFVNGTINLRMRGGITATATGSEYTSPLGTYATYGAATDVIWDATTSKFWVVSSTGNIWSATAANAVVGTWTYFNNVLGTGTVAGPFGLGGTVFNTIEIIGTTIQVTSNQAPTVLYVGNTTNANLWTNITITAGPNQSVISNRGAYTGRNYSGQQFSANNGTDVVYASTASNVSIYTPSIDKYQPRNVVSGIGNIQTVNGNNFAYGGSSNSGDISGFYTGANLITGLGNFYTISGITILGASNINVNKAAYVDGQYYITDSNFQMYSGTSLTNISNPFDVSNQTIAGIKSVVSENMVNDGNLSSYESNSQLRMSKTTTTPILGLAAITASIVEIT